MKQVLFAVVVVACSSPSKPKPAEPAPDPVAEAKPAVVETPKPLAWVKDQAKKSKTELEAAPGFAQTRDRIRGILDSKEKTPYVAKRGTYYYNFWRDAQNPKGLIRRTSLAEYKKKEPKWELILDIDQLAKDEKENWVYAGNQCLYPKFD